MTRSILGVMLGVATAAGDQLETIELLEGTSIQATVASIREDGQISGEGIEKPLHVNDVRALVRSTVGPVAAAGAITVELSGAGQLRAKRITLADESCQIAWKIGDDLRIPIDALRTIRFDVDPPIESFQSAAGNPVAGFDRVFVKDGERVHQIPGLLDKLTADAVIFIRDDDEVRLPRSRVYGLVLADVGEAALDGARCRVQLRDGSIISGAVEKLGDGVLSIKVLRAATVAVPWNFVSRIDVESPRLTYLSDMEPAEIFQRSIVSVSRPWQRDRSVTGQALELRVTEGQSPSSIGFKKGIGTQPQCRLTYNVGGGYELFLAALGIHTGTGGRGDCVVSVLADGKEVYSQRVTGRDQQPHQIRLDIRGVRRLTIAVEPGNDLDLADHVNWCDARLIRKSS